MGLCATSAISNMQYICIITPYPLFSINHHNSGPIRPISFLFPHNTSVRTQHAQYVSNRSNTLPLETHLSIYLSFPTNLAVCCSNRVPPKFLVNKSELLSSLDCHHTSKVPSSFSSLRKLSLVPMCRVRPETPQPLNKSTAPLLSIQSNIGFFTFSSMDSITRIANNIS